MRCGADLKLTIGIPTYKDFDGWWFTVASLYEHHDLSDCELLTVDNSPDSPEGEAVRKSCTQWPGMRYVPQPSPVGTAPAKDRVFAEATGDIVLCIDSHVILGKRAIDAVFFALGNESQRNVLLHGPLCFDGTNTISTHLNRHWGSGMPGQWVRGWLHRCGISAAPRRLPNGLISWETITQNCVSVACCGCGPLDTGAWDGHESRVRAAGWQPLDETNRRWEIGAHGTGLFACRRETWPKFCDGAAADMTGFGCEEWHLHDLWRSLGGRVVMTPQLRWRHRFRQEHHEYRPELLDQARNAILWSKRLGRDPATIRQHFPRVDAATWELLARGERPQPTPPATSPANAAPPPCSLAGLNVLAKVAGNVGVVDPQGVAFPCALRAEAKTVVANVGLYPSARSAVEAAHAEVRRGAWGTQTFTAHFSDGNFDALRKDLVFFANVAADRRDAMLCHAIVAAKWIAITPKPAVTPAILGSWHQVETSPASEFAFFAEWAEYWTPEFLGPGTQLQWLIAELGLGDGKKTCEACSLRAKQMDDWGVRGCESNRETILGWLHAAAAEAGIVDKLRAAVKLPAAALLDPCDWLLTEAIRRSREGLKATAESHPAAT